MPISVVLPAYNEEADIKACLERLIQQGEAVAEIIVVNNNSTDATAHLVREIARRDKRVRIIDEPKPGVSHARYAGFDNAAHNIIASIDSDTRVQAGWADSIQTTFAEHPEIVAGGAPMIMHDLPFQGRYARAHQRHKNRAEEALKKNELIELPALSGANSAIRRSVWHQVRGKVSYRRDVFEDLDMSLIMREAGHPLAIIPGMNATVSGRRLLCGPRELVRYAACSSRTYRLHGQRGVAAVADAANVLVIARTLTMLPVNRAWNPDIGKFSMKQLVSGRGEARRSPIGSGLD